MFAASSLKGSLDNNTLNLPHAETIQGIPNKIHYHIVADDAFPLSLNILKPYPQRNLDRPKRIFNYRLSRSRRVVENAFGILANRFRVFLTTINLSPYKVTNANLAACCLHNVWLKTASMSTSVPVILNIQLDTPSLMVMGDKTKHGGHACNSQSKCERECQETTPGADRILLVVGSLQGQLSSWSSN